MDQAETYMPRKNETLPAILGSALAAGKKYRQGFVSATTPLRPFMEGSLQGLYDGGRLQSITAGVELQMSKEPSFEEILLFAKPFARFPNADLFSIRTEDKDGKEYFCIDWDARGGRYDRFAPDMMTSALHPEQRESVLDDLEDALSLAPASQPTPEGWATGAHHTLLQAREFYANIKAGFNSRDLYLSTSFSVETSIEEQPQYIIRLDYSADVAMAPDRDRAIAQVAGQWSRIAGVAPSENIWSLQKEEASPRRPPELPKKPPTTYKDTKETFEETDGEEWKRGNVSDNEEWKDGFYTDTDSWNS